MSEVADIHVPTDRKEGAATAAEQDVAHDWWVEEESLEDGIPCSGDGAGSTSHLRRLSLPESTATELTKGSIFGSGGTSSSAVDLGASEEADGWDPHATRPGSASRESSQGITNIWTELLFNSNASLWGGSGLDEHDYKGNERGGVYGREETSWYTCARDYFKGVWYEQKHFCAVCWRHPSIVLKALLVFAVVCSAGLAVAKSQIDAEITSAQNSASFIANELGKWFNAEFTMATHSLYHVQQALAYMYSDSTLSDLPARILAAPYLPDHVHQKPGGPAPKKDVSEICDDLELNEIWKSVVESAGEDSGGGNVVYRYRLLPANVMCAAYPKCKKYDLNGMLTNVGFDTGHATTMSTLWQQTLTELFIDKDLGMSIFGPMEDADQPGSEIFCGHLPVWQSPGPDGDAASTIDVFGTTVKNAWGYVGVDLNWKVLKEKSGIYERYSEANLEFCVENEAGKVIAKSARAHLLDDSNSIIVQTKGVMGLWHSRVGVPAGWRPSWSPYIISGVVLASLLIATLTAKILMERQVHRDLLYKIMPRDAVKKLQRGQTVLEKYNLVTIFFSDIVGFTDIAGEMRPVQVMRMLNDLYTEFDKLVDKHGVYKVETIGDAYMVVGGAPDRCSGPEAAQRVALFALEAVAFVKEKFRTKERDRIFIRSGLASGPVVAGVVGQSMPRYCFFGDTVNLASRMESTSDRMKIQCSELTYRLLQDAPNNVFDLEERRDGNKVGVDIKGKGRTAAWWIVDTRKRDGTEKMPAGDIEEGGIANQFAQANRRLDFVGISEVSADVTLPTSEDRRSFASEDLYNHLTFQAWPRLGQPDSDMVGGSKDRKVMVKRASSILEHYLLNVVKKRDGRSFISPTVKDQLQTYVDFIARTYNPNVKFHNFEHASHVLVSMNKIVNVLKMDPPTTMFRGLPIKPDPLLYFSLVFSALIHDAGHTGMSNKILQDIGHPLAEKFGEGFPLAERYSIDLGLEILFRPKFSELRAAIIPADREVDKLLFGKALFQAILVTDITNPAQNKLCVKRYEVASGPSLDDQVCPCAICSGSLQDPLTHLQVPADDGREDLHVQSDEKFKEEKNLGFTERSNESSSSISSNYDPDLCPLARHLGGILKGVGLQRSVTEKYPTEFVITHCGLQFCVLIEHLMQVSDVAHLMQGWRNFVKWNFRLYKEIKSCHRRGLCPDPRDGWYEGQIGFLKHYVIPLAERTRAYFGGGVGEFGQDLVRLAETNLKLWEQHGKVSTEAFIDGEWDDEASVLEGIYKLDGKDYAPEANICIPRSSGECVKERAIAA